MDLRCSNTRGKYAEVTDTEIKVIDYQQICNDNRFCGI